MILAILFAVLGYRKADETGRNKVVWAILMVVIFIGVQLLAGILVGVFVGIIGIGMLGWSENFFEVYYWPINLAGVAIAVVSCSGVLYFLGKKPVVDMSEPPPPPAEFE